MPWAAKNATARFQELDAGRGAFAFEDLDVGQARAVINTHMDVLPAGTATAGAPVTVDAMPLALIRPSFLTSMWISSPGTSRS